MPTVSLNCPFRFFIIFVSSNSNGDSDDSINTIEYTFQMSACVREYIFALSQWHQIKLTSIQSHPAPNTYIYNIYSEYINIFRMLLASRKNSMQNKLFESPWHVNKVKKREYIKIETKNTNIVIKTARVNSESTSRLEQSKMKKKTKTIKFSAKCEFSATDACVCVFSYFVETITIFECVSPSGLCH